MDDLALSPSAVPAWPERSGDSFSSRSGLVLVSRETEDLAPRCGRMSKAALRNNVRYHRPAKEATSGEFLIYQVVGLMASLPAA